MKYVIAVLTVVLLALIPKSYAQSQGSAVVVIDSKTGEVALGIGSDAAVEEFQRSGAQPPTAPLGQGIEFGVSNPKVDSNPDAADEVGLIRVATGGNSSLFWSYFPSVTAAGGVQIGEALEVGVEAGLIIAVFTIGWHADVYARLSPIPVGFGKRIYVGALVGKAKLIDPTDSGSSVVDPYSDFFVGYRNWSTATSAQRNGYWFAEVGTRTMGPSGDRRRGLALKFGIMGIGRYRAD